MNIEHGDMVTQETSSHTSSQLVPSEAESTITSKSTATGLTRPSEWQMRTQCASVYDALTKEHGNPDQIYKSCPSMMNSNHSGLLGPNTDTNSTGPPPVYLAVADRTYEAGLRRFTKYPAMAKDGLLLSKTEGVTNVYMLTDSVEVISDSGGDSPDVSQKSQVDEPKQNSFVTIFSMWNTMMGTSVLAMPWTLTQAGFTFGVILILVVAGIACYTAVLAVKCVEDLRAIQRVSHRTYMDIADACQYYFGKAGRIVALIFSQLSLLGASTVYYVLLANFLYYTGDYIYQLSTNSFPQPPLIEGNTLNITDILCPPYAIANETVAGPQKNDLFTRLWSQDRTVPAWLLILLIPLISIKSPTCLGKFASMATVSVVYLFVLIGIKGYGWGVNMSDPPLIEPVPHYRNYFVALTGTCSLAFYIHNSIQTLTRQQRHPENNVRDVIIAFCFATITYALMGTMFFIVFPVSKLCIQDNYLNNLVTDIPVFIARLALLFQMCMVYPMLVYILRAQVMNAIFGKIYPTWYYVLIVHIVVLGIGLLFAIVYPSIGTIIRFIGALCGLVYVFTIPPIITLLNGWVLGHVNTAEAALNSEIGPKQSLLTIPTERREWKDKRTKVLWIVQCVFYSIIMLFGLLNFIAQFVLLGYQ